MKSRILKLTLPVLFLTLAAQSSGAQVPVYTETFDNNTGSNQDFDTVGWSGVHSATGIAYPTDNTNNETPIISSAASSTGSTPGYIFHNTFEGKSPVMYYEDGLSLGAPAGGEVLDSVSFALRNVSTSQNIQIALEFGMGNWYLSDTTFNNATSNVWTSNLVVDLSAETWKGLNVDIGTDFSVGAAAALPTLATSSLTGIGFFTASTSNNNNIRIDTLEVSAVPVPEPATFAALTGALALGMIMRRRRS